MLSFIIENATEIFAIATGLVTLAGAVTALTPSPKDDGVVKQIRAVLDIVALNFGHAKNR